MSKSNPAKSQCKNLVLDSGPLLSLSPLRGLAETYFTVPQVLAELKDHRARQHFEQLGLMSGVKVEVRSPDAASLLHVIQWAKKTGDYAVLSHPDTCVLALTYMLNEEAKKPQPLTLVDTQPVSSDDAVTRNAPSDSAVSVEQITEKLQSANIEQGTLEIEKSDFSEAELVDELSESERTLEVLDDELHPLKDDETTTLPKERNSSQPVQYNSKQSSTPIFEDPSDSDDGEGEWITPGNVALHKSHAMNLLPGFDGKAKGKQVKEIDAGCMTADFAMQNVILQMGLNLVGLEGQRIERIKSWILRCHACFALCKDNSKKFCPSCGNPTLIRASVTVAAPDASGKAPALQVHLKPNFQYKIRGTKYSIPAPKPGSAKTGSGAQLILREDQQEYLRATKMAEGKREREEARLLKGILSKGVTAGGGISSWMDPDWTPEMLSVNSGGKGRTMRNSKLDGDLPRIGYGRTNPNQARKRK